MYIVLVDLLILILLRTCFLVTYRSFAAATLAKDVTTTPSGAIINARSGDKLSTENREELFDLEYVNASGGTPIEIVSHNGTGGRLLSHYGPGMGQAERDLQVKKFETRAKAGRIVISHDKVNKLMHKLCSSWNKWSGFQNFGCNGVSDCRSGVDRVRLMLPKGW